MAKAVVALGSNLPGRFASTEALLEAALDALSEAGMRLACASTAWRSVAWPDPNAPAFLNRVALVETRSPPETILRALLDFERTFGRVRGQTNAPRTLDLDLIDYDGRVISAEGLILPHPRAHQRLFVMGPLAEIAPEWLHPVLQRTASELAASASIGADAARVLPRCNIDR